ncbi:MAG: hypothetical protein ABI831_04400, partial [Betaproteobacteria bacterium]
MATSFAITTPKPKYELGSERKGEASFTVTNTTERTLRGLLKIKPLDKTQLGWLTPSGDAERTFTGKGTHQVSVKIEVPASAPAGTYSFRLDAISVDNPDEDYTEGQAMAIEVPPPPPEKPKKFPWWIPVVIVLILVIAGFALWSLLPKK